MIKKKKRCTRCMGRKKLYKKGGGYSLVNSGGALVECPLCAGEGEIDTLDEFLRKQEEEKKIADEKAEEKKEIKEKFVEKVEVIPLDITGGAESNPIVHPIIEEARLAEEIETEKPKKRKGRPKRAEFEE